jgi:hypothetical protein
VKKLKSYNSDSADYRIKVSFRNKGKLPTALKQAHLVRIVKDDMVVIDFDSTGGSPGKKDYKIILDEKPVPPDDRRGGFNDDRPPVQKRSYSKNIPFTDGGAVTTASINIRLYNRTELKARAGVISTRGGILKDKEFVIK